MNKSLAGLAYRREKKLKITFDDVTQRFTLLALSAKDDTTALLEAQRIHAETVKLLPNLAESIGAVCLLQDTDTLLEAVLQTEYDQLLHKASLTLVEGEPQYEEKLTVKAEKIKETRRAELAALTKEKLAEKLVQVEVNQQLNLAWNCALLEARLVQALFNDDGQKLFSSVEQMKEVLPTEVLVQLYGAMAEFLSERGNAQVFPEPHTSNG